MSVKMTVCYANLGHEKRAQEIGAAALPMTKDVGIQISEIEPICNFFQKADFTIRIVVRELEDVDPNRVLDDISVPVQKLLGDMESFVVELIVGPRVFNRAYMGGSEE